MAYERQDDLAAKGARGRVRPVLTGSCSNAGRALQRGGTVVGAPPNPGANQYELHLDRANLPGGREVDYVVAMNRDVSGQVNIGPIRAPIAISHQQADASFQAAGPLAQTARDAVARSVADIGRQAEKLSPACTSISPVRCHPGSRKHRK